MGSGSIYTPVVFTLEDLKKVYDRDAHGTKGMWSFHRSFHGGHEQCRKFTVQNSDWILGILWNNFAAGMEKLVDKSVDYDDCIDPSDINILKHNANVVMIFTGNYHPYLEYKEFIFDVIKKDFSYDRLKEKGIIDNIGMWGSFVYSVAVRLMIHEIHGIKIDYDGNCGKEIWRWAGYGPWCKKRFGINVDLLEPVSDKFGNNYSTIKARMPEELTKRINKKLMLEHFNSIEDVQEHIKDIEGLKAEWFSKDQEWIRCKFYFNEKLWWTEALKLCK